LNDETAIALALFQAGRFAEGRDVVERARVEARRNLPAEGDPGRADAEGNLDLFDKAVTKWVARIEAEKDTACPVSASQAIPANRPKFDRPR
jgi:hypothetical protein